jgi:hypothetical protein
MLKRPKPKPLDRDRAEEIGVEALTFLAADDTRLARFLGLTGIAPGDLVAGARSPAMLTAVLEHLAGDESMLLVFAAEAGLPPEQIAGAIALLDDAS